MHYPSLRIFFLILVLIAFFGFGSLVPVPSLRSKVVSGILGPELDEIRDHLKIIPEIRSHMNEVSRVVQDIRTLIAKIPTINKSSLFRIPGQ